jgi:phosphoribosyl 1,2-cyclic phosphodiesterase
MSLYVASLNSGSNGNCYYIGNGEEAVLIDGGISCRETEKRMKRLALSMKQVKALFVTHEHGDHTHGIARLSKKYQLPVYITNTTLQFSNLPIDSRLAIPFRNYEPIAIGQLTVTSFPKFHDASDPCSFIVANEKVKVGVFTDIGVPCEHVVRHFEQCHAAFLESNYDEEMLDRGGYPIALKNRIKGGEGHLSNRQALQLFTDHRPPFMTHLFLSHLSRNNNTHRIVQSLFDSQAGNTEIIIASRFRETKVHHIRDAGPVNPRNQTKPKGFSYQLNLFR